MSYMNGICWFHFPFGKPLVKNTFFKSFPKKNAQIVNLKNPDLDLIRRIHPECGFYGFMIRLWICTKKREIRFWIRKSRFGFSRKTHPWLSSIGKSGFRFWNLDFGFCNRTRNPKTDCTSAKSVFRVDFNSGFRGFPFYKLIMIICI